MTTQALEKAKQGGVEDYEDAFSMLCEAWELADSAECRDIIRQHVEETEESLDESARKHQPDFLDKAENARGDIYKRLADYGNTRGQRLYAEYIWESDAEQAAQYLFKAANGGDGRACYLAAQFCFYGCGGVTESEENALGWLFAAAKAGYAPAKEKLAAAYWEGDRNWGVGRDQELAQSYLKEAIGIYRSWTLGNASSQEKLSSHCEQLEHVGELMASFGNRASGSVAEGFYPSFLAMRLSFYSESDSGLRVRLFYINEYMRRYTKTYHLDTIPALDLECIPIHMAKLDENIRGRQYSRSPESDQVDLRIQIDSESMPPMANSTGATRERAYWRREMALNGTIAHELAHAYLDTRYSFNYSDTQCGKPLAEGHAQSAEFAFLRTAYYAGRLSADEFADMQSDAYARYFRWYQEHCTDSHGCTDWESVKRWAKESGGAGQCTRTPVTSRYGPQYVPQFFGPAFLGYL